MPEAGDLPNLEEEFLGIVRPTPEQEKEAADKAQEERLKRQQFLQRLLAQQMFRSWLMEKLSQFGTFTHNFGVTPNYFPDPMGTQYAMGMKAAGWTLWEELDAASPELASLMRREARGEA